MSRGPGRVQRVILGALARGPGDARTLAVIAQAREDSTRRALRRLRRAGQVAYVGQGYAGAGVWCLPEHEEAARARCLPEESLDRVARVMGGRFARSLRRASVGTL